MSDDHNIYPELRVERREQPSTKGKQVLMVHKQDDWMIPIVHFLKEGQLSENRIEARKVQIRVVHFVIIDDVLYR